MAKKGSATEIADESGSAGTHDVGSPVHSAEETAGNGKYTVVARRYRPKTFAELVGQSTVAHALLNAIESNRVGHAYLFTGARGVGKTSTARIFAKALNASAEANGKFDPNSEMALAIDSGEDMDVLEIDGASNRGIDEIRQLRANAAVRPSRSRYKIYIIDEVHMLTTQAFNALLKTLEEPPGHVKFIFCTTDPEKIPITVLSRCQRFDFPPVHSEQIYERLKFICENEGTKADEGALRLIARRAAGSMRDSQSLLEQLLSFGGNEITADVVHAMLGTADETRLAIFASRLIERDAAGALRELDGAASEGVDVGQLAEQLLGYLRDMMAVSVGGSADLIRTANPNSVEQLREWGKMWGTMTLLSALQLLDETIVRMRHSVQSRVLLEVALVQICNLQDLQSLSELVKAFASNLPAPAPRPVAATQTSPAPAADPKKKVELSEPSGVPAGAPNAVTAAFVASAAPLTVTAAASPSPNVSQVSPPSTATTSFHSSIVSESKPVMVPSSSAATPNPTGPSAIVAPKPPTVAHSPTSVVTHTNAATPVSAPSQPMARPANTAVPGPSSSGSPEPAKAVANNGPQDNLSILKETATKLGGFAHQCALLTVRVDAPSDHQWKICLSRDGAMVQDYFQTGDNGKRLAQAIKQRVGRGIHLEYVVTNEPSPHVEVQQEAEPVVAVAEVESYAPTVPQAQLIRNAMGNPLVKQFMDVFEGQIVRVDPVQVRLPRPHVETIAKPSEAIDEANVPESEYETADSE